MYKTSVPIAIQSISDDNLEQDLHTYLNWFKKGHINRVFIAVLPAEYTYAFDHDINSYKFKRAVEFFKSSGMEVGVWIGGFGHGVTLSHESGYKFKEGFTKMAGVDGKENKYSCCPLDENFVNDYMNNIKKIASLNPDIIMIDDDFRLNKRDYHLGCFCEKHLKEYYRIIGEEIPREKIEGLAFSGGRNKYRDAYMEMSKNTLLGFAKRTRAAVDEVNPTIRVGACSIWSVWDFEGTDETEVAKAFAGDTKPFLRACGAPYEMRHDMIKIIEAERMQFNWSKTLLPEAEIFSEGDVYPRPRYNIASKSLELFELALMCDGNSDGILKYMFVYDMNVSYESSYIEKHIKMQDINSSIRDMFRDKTPTGISVFSELHKVRDWVLPLSSSEEKAADKIINISPDAYEMLSKNSIATCYSTSDYPVMLTGENARHIPLDMLKNGAILDATAARILNERGIDTGLLSLDALNEVNDEYFTCSNEILHGVGVGFWLNGPAQQSFYKLVCNDKVNVTSVFKPSDTVASYLYENDNGTRFFVFAADFRFTTNTTNYYNNYYRQKQLVSGIEWLCGKKLPAISTKHPNLYILASKNENAMSVLLLNIFMDEVENPIIELDKPYKNVKFINCDGELKGDRLYLSDITPYGYAVFEVSI